MNEIFSYMNESYRDADIDQLCFICKDRHRVKKVDLKCGHGQVCFKCRDGIGKGNMKCIECDISDNFVFPSTSRELSAILNADIPTNDENWFTEGEKINKNALRVPKNLFTSGECPSNWKKVNNKSKRDPIGKWEKNYFLLLHYLDNGGGNGQKIPRNLEYDDYIFEDTPQEYVEKYKVGEWFYDQFDSYSKYNDLEINKEKKIKMNKKQLVWMDHLVINGIVWWDMSQFPSKESGQKQEESKPADPLGKSNKSDNQTSKQDGVNNDNHNSTDVDDNDYNGDDSDLGSFFDGTDDDNNNIDMNETILDGTGVIDKIFKNGQFDEQQVRKSGIPLSKNNSTPIRSTTPDTTLYTPKKARRERYVFEINVQMTKTDVTGNSRNVYAILLGQFSSMSKVSELKNKIIARHPDYKNMKLIYNYEELFDEKTLYDCGIDARSGVVVCEKL